MKQEKPYYWMIKYLIIFSFSLNIGLFISCNLDFREKKREGEWNLVIDSTLLIEGEYTDGNKSGIWKYYDHDGILIKSDFLFPSRDRKNIEYYSHDGGLIYKEYIRSSGSTSKLFYPASKFLVGKNIHNEYCVACHNMNSTLIGPALSQVIKKGNYQSFAIVFNPDDIYHQSFTGLDSIQIECLYEFLTQEIH